MLSSETICAISTARGMGAIAVLRLSGSEAIELADRIFCSPHATKRLADQKGHTLHFGSIVDESREVDEVVVSLFRSPHSFTGEDVVEISCHGSVVVQQQILQLMVRKGARLALPGEFTQRAFVNGKMDLSQAEAVADLIAAQSEAARRVAFRQMRGGFSSQLDHLRERLLHLITLMELELDFSEEDVEFADRKQLIDLVEQIEQLLSRLIQSFSLGNAIKNGIPVAIVGHTNAGKSTLLNALLNEERAIVSDIHGTTRDVIEDVLNIEGIAFRFIDTAGIRKTSDTIESIGINRTFAKIEQASIVLLLIDATDSDAKIHEAVASVKGRMEGSRQKLVVVVNKTDLVSEAVSARFNSEAFYELSGTDVIVPISAKNQLNIQDLIRELLQTIQLDPVENDEVIVTNVRHYEALLKSRDAILRVISGLQTGLSGDLVSQDSRECLHYMGEITGQISTDEVLGNIFRNFCIGK